jgi:hypothetical protein
MFVERCGSATWFGDVSPVKTILAKRAGEVLQQPCHTMSLQVSWLYTWAVYWTPLVHHVVSSGRAYPLVVLAGNALGIMPEAI